MILMQVLFWALIAVVAYHHVVYPVLLHVLVRLKIRFAPEAVAPLPQELPSVTLVVPAHNERNVIARKIANIAGLIYPADLLHVVIACDGCTDDTAAIARDLIGGRDGWRVSEREFNIGKIAVLNEEIAAASTDIIALNDASALINAEALLFAMRHFSDPDMGVVCGTYVLDLHAPEPDREYWRYQTAIKKAEAALAAPLGAHGAFYLFRKAPWRPLPPDTINDDVILPMSIVLAGFRCVYDPRIVATELDSASPQADFRRRIRIGAGNVQQAIRLAALAHPSRSWLSFVFISGKFLRALMPFVLAAIVILAVALSVAGHVFYQLVVLGFCLMVLAAVVLPAPNRIMMVLAGYAASGVGALMLLAGRGSTVWQLSSLVNRSRQ